jgi:acetyltransferase-like isoleucine patch superfamily enzyme
MKNVLSTILDRFIKYINKIILSRKNIIIGKYSNFENIILEKHIKIGRNCNISQSYVGMGTYIGSNSVLPNTKIGRFCSIASNVTIALGNHPTSDYVSTHPSFFSTRKQSGFTFVKKSCYEELKFADENYYVSIGNDVWIGTNVTILNGVSIGHGAIVGAGAVVTKDIEPFTINIGVPSKSIKKRFPDEEIKYLLELNWWDKDFEWIKQNSKYFTDIKYLMQNI